MTRKHANAKKYTNENAFPEGVNLWDLEKIVDPSELHTALSEVIRMNHEQPKNLFMTLKKYREHSATIIRWAMTLQELRESSDRQLNHLMGKAGERSNKRWTESEDMALVELAANDQHSLVELSVTFGRSPAAISSRLTYLVGIKKVSQEIAGRIIGFIDGEPVNGYFSGELRAS